MTKREMQRLHQQAIDADIQVARARAALALPGTAPLARLGSRRNLVIRRRCPQLTWGHRAHGYSHNAMTSTFAAPLYSRPCDRWLNAATRGRKERT